MKTKAVIRHEIELGIRRAKKRGLKIVAGTWGIQTNVDGTIGPNDGEVCPLGACLVGKKAPPDDYAGVMEVQDEPDVVAEALLGYSKDWIDGFVGGADGQPEHWYAESGSVRSGYLLGQEFREKLGLGVDDED